MLPHGSQVQLATIQGFSSRALDVEFKPADANTGATYPDQAIDFSVAGTGHSHGQYLVTFDLMVEHTGSTIGTFDISLLTEDNKPIYSLQFNMIELDGLQDSGFSLMSARRDAAGIRLITPLAIAVPGTRITVHSTMNMDTGLFALSLRGPGVRAPVQVTQKLMLQNENRNLKTLQLSFNSKDTRPVHVGIDNVVVSKL